VAFALELRQIHLFWHDMTMHATNQEDLQSRCRNSQVDSHLIGSKMISKLFDAFLCELPSKCQPSTPAYLPSRVRVPNELSRKLNKNRAAVVQIKLQALEYWNQVSTKAACIDVWKQALEDAKDDVQPMHIDHDDSNMVGRISDAIYEIIKIFAHPPDICDNGCDPTDQGDHRFRHGKAVPDGSELVD
jgi:hypothetical protein